MSLISYFSRQYVMYYFFIAVTCDNPRNISNQPTLIVIVRSEDDQYRGIEITVSSLAFFGCEFGEGGLGTNIVRHPSVCQADGTWSMVEETCEGN